MWGTAASAPAESRRSWGQIAAMVAAAMLPLVLIAPALWNGYPLLQYDTGGYLARWYEGTLEISRSTVYGLFVAAGVPFGFWPVIILQAALSVWIIALLLRLHGMGGRPRILLLTVVVLSAGTSLPWLADLLLTDIFAPLAVLGLYLLLRADDLRRHETAALVVLVAFASATHSATLAVLVVLTASALGVAVLAPHRLPPLRVLRAVTTLALGAAMLVGANYAVARRVSWTPGGYGVAFARLLQDGIVARYLAEHCPDRRLRLCLHRHDLPATADMFLWGKRPNETQSLFDRLGRFDGLGQEMRTIVIESLIAYPRLQIEAALVATGRQLARVATGEGTVNTIWHTYAIMRKFAPQLEPAMRAARQQHEGLNFEPINRLHVPLALLSMALLPVIVLLCCWRMLAPESGALAAFVALALLSNAAICGILSNPHDRYGSRLAPLAPLALAIVALRWRDMPERRYRTAPPALEGHLP